MASVRELWKASDRISLFVISLVALLVLLLAGLILADRSLRQSTDEQATLDATTSARIVAQEVELAGERLFELSTTAVRQEREHNGTGAPPAGNWGRTLQAIWVFDTTGQTAVDSLSWTGATGVARAGAGGVLALARRVAGTRRLELQGLPGTANATRGGGGNALLGEPIMENGVFTGIAVALVDEAQLLAPAADATVEGRSFVALLVDGDTVSPTPGAVGRGRRSAPARVPLPGEPAWFVVSGQMPRENATRVAIWSIGAGALVLLFFGLVRERRQTARIAERSVELERLSAELLRANRMKSEFLASVSHELRTPLNAIVGFVDLLKEGAYGALSERQISPVDRIATSAARLRTLVDEVLDIAKIAAGRLEVRMETVTLRPFLTNVVSEIEPLLQEKGLRVTIAVDREVARVRSDPTHLRQILINLLGNAVKYTRAGSIELRARIDHLGPPPRSLAATGQHAAFHADRAGRWCAIDVRDSGIGIATGDLERIFEEFEQVKPQGAEDPEDRGTGLGLVISRRLAALLGGDVSVESALGTGSTFTIWLPAHE